MPEKLGKVKQPINNLSTSWYLPLSAAAELTDFGDRAENGLWSRGPLLWRDPLLSSLYNMQGPKRSEMCNPESKTLTKQAIVVRQTHRQTDRQTDRKLVKQYRALHALDADARKNSSSTSKI